MRQRPFIDPSDAVFLVGLALLGAGAWMAWPPAGPMVLGATLIATSVAGEIRRSAAGRETKS